MTILKVANVHFTQTGNNRLEYTGNGVVRLTANGLQVPVGTTGARPSGEAGIIRYNSSTGTFEGHNASGWGAIGGQVDFGPTGDAANAYARTVGTAGNNYTIAVGAAANTWANTISDAKVTAANAYARTVGTAGNSYTNTVGTGGNSYTNTVGTAGNNYTNTVGAASNTYAVTVGTAGNSYTQTVGAAANTRADTKVSSVSGTSGRITSSGGTTPAIDLATAGAGASTYSTGISAVTVDAYGRVTSVTGSAGYITGSGSTTGSAGTFTSTTQNSQFNSIGVGTAASGTGGEIRATNNITAYFSDKRLKKNVQKILNALEKINMISGVTFESNEIAEKYGYTDKKTQVGVLAQEVEQVLPEIVVPAPFDIGKNEDGTEYSLSGENYKTVQYEKLVPLLIQAIKELKSEIDLLKKGKEY